MNSSRPTNSLSGFLVLCFVVTVTASSRRFITYVDTAGVNWSAQPPTPIVDVAPTAYTAVHCGFYLPSIGGPSDFAFTLTNTNPAYGGPLFVESMHNASKRVILTVGGATETPTSAAYFTSNDPVKLATTLADLVKASNLDGVGIDWEDDYSNSNPGLTGYGTAETRKPGGGPAVAWLVTLTQTLRTLLPRKDGYTISHAPQAPYFGLGYGEVYKQAGDDIDYFTVQFYNQGNYYVTASGLVDKETIVPTSHPSCVSPWDGSITDIVENYGVPAEKIVVGKIVTTGDGNSGYVPAAEFVSMLQAAVSKYPTLGGAMGWQWGSDTSGAWMKELTTAFTAAGGNGNYTTVGQ